MLRWLEPIDPERSWPWLQSFLTDKHTKIRDAGKSIDLKGICYLFSFFFWGGCMREYYVLCVADVFCL